MLIRRSHIALFSLVALAFPAAALAATDSGGDRPHEAVGAAEVVPPLETSSQSFRALVADVSRQLEREEDERVAKREREEREAFEAFPGGVSIETLEAIAACESGGDPTIVSADGSYRGKYQFSFSTWESVGGSGDPAAAPEIEQDYRAALLYSQAGSSPWPVCG